MLSLANDVAARFEAGADRSVGGGWAQHPVDRQGSWGPAADCQPLAASLCRLWLEGLQDEPRSGKQPIYTRTPDKRILKLLDELPAQRVARWTGPLVAGAPGALDVQYVWRFLRSHKMDLAGRLIDCLR